MNFSIGYNPTLDFSIPDAYRRYFNDPRIGEVYFACIGTISGHDMTQTCNSHSDSELKEHLVHNLRHFREGGTELSLLLNASCYGVMEATVDQENYVDSILKDLDSYGLFPEVLTVCSPFIARYVKRKYPEIEVRMSVLNCISSISAMQLTVDAFDSYYINQDLNRDMTFVRIAKKWCNDNGKKLCMVVNSGCIGSCPYKMNHGNHSSHCYERERFNGYLPCTKIWDNVIKDRVLAVLQGNWIRPEDLHYYEGLCDVAKLDTRLNFNLQTKVDAYLNCRYDGNLIDVISATNPFYPLIDNRRFPSDYFEKMTRCCHKHCDQCKYCLEIRNNII